MYREPIFLKPVFQERIWGGEKLKQEYNYDIPSKHTGEAWVISAHPNGPNVIENGFLAGKTLAEAWNNHGELFNKKQEEYPLLVKVLDANDNLSVQVHPDDTFAREVENQPYGKTECWYVLSAELDAELVLGHHAKTREELEKMMDHEEWDQLLNKVKVKAGDFFYVPSGTIHAIGEGIVILEIQQSSDITYRVYDYDRTDADGNKRELHLERSKQVATVPHQQIKLARDVQQSDGLKITTLVQEEYFSVFHWQLNGKAEQEMTTDFLQISVIEGKAELTTTESTVHVEKGEHFILPYGMGSYRLSGEAEMIVSHS